MTGPANGVESPSFTVASLIAAAQSADLPPPTVATLVKKLAFPVCRLPYCGHSRFSRTRFTLYYEELVDAAHDDSYMDARFSGIVSLPSLASILSRAGGDALVSLLGESKSRLLADLGKDERNAADEALESFFSLDPDQTTTLSVLEKLRDVLTVFNPTLAQRTWKSTTSVEDGRFESVSFVSDALNGGQVQPPQYADLWLSRDVKVDETFAALSKFPQDVGDAGIYEFRNMDRETAWVLRQLNDTLTTTFYFADYAIVLLLDGMHFVPILVVFPVPDSPIRELIIDTVPEQRAQSSISLDSFELESHDAARLFSKESSAFKTRMAPPNKRVLICGTPLPFSHGPEQQDLLRILALSTLASHETIGAQVEQEVVRLIHHHSRVTTSHIPRSPPAISFMRAVEHDERSLPVKTSDDSLPCPSTSLSDAGTTDKSVDAPPGRPRYRLVSFNELEKGCAFTAAFVGEGGRLVGFHSFPRFGSLGSQLAKIPSLPPTPPPTPPPTVPFQLSSKPASRPAVQPEPLLLLSSARMGSGNQGHVYRAHCSDSPILLLAKYSYSAGGSKRLQAEAAFYRENRVKLEEDELAPRFVGSWETSGANSPMELGTSTTMILVEEWGEALKSWRDVKGADARQHLQNLVLRFHSNNFRHNSLNPRNIVWKPKVGPSSMRLIDFARSDTHNCTDMADCLEVMVPWVELRCPTFREDVCDFVEKRRAEQVMEEELSRVARVERELEEQAKRESGLSWTVVAGEAPAVAEPLLE